MTGYVGTKIGSGGSWFLPANWRARWRNGRGRIVRMATPDEDAAADALGVVRPVKMKAVQARAALMAAEAAEAAKAAEIAVKIDALAVEFHDAGLTADELEASLEARVAAGELTSHEADRVVDRFEAIKAEEIEASLEAIKAEGSKRSKKTPTKGATAKKTPTKGATAKKASAKRG